MEAAELCLFMVSAGVFTLIIQSSALPVRDAIPSPLIRRALVGAAMGLTSIALVYSPWGRQSGAHFNPAITFVFWRLGKVKTLDAIGYVIAQFPGGIAGVLFVSGLLGDSFRDAPVNYVATLPGPAGLGWALVAELFISFLLMSTVLFATNRQRLAKYTGLLTGSLVAMFITFEAPLSGMSMNPARTFSSAFAAGIWQGLWIYFVAPPVGMLLAVEARKHLFSLPMRACAKLYHDNDKRCIFCGRHVQFFVLLVCCAVSLKARAPATAVGPIVITVSNLDESVRFYTDDLCFKYDSQRQGSFKTFDRITGLHATNVRVANLHLGAQHIQLLQFVKPPGHPYPAASRSNDDWFQHIAIVVRDMDVAYARLRRFHVQEISSGPQTLPAWNKDAAGIRAIYFRDPDSHPLELIYFPPGKGDQRWQQHRSELFLGIDHTAIAVQNTDLSIAFYIRLGFRVIGKSLNYGNEQELLNGIANSRVRITSLRLSAAPGIELLEYLVPRDAKRFPPMTMANDLWHDYTTILVGDLTSARAIPRGPVELMQPLAGAGVRGAVTHDPDGHDILLRMPLQGREKPFQ
jgi:aquaporin Z